MRYPLGDDLSTRGGEQMFKIVLNTLEPIAARHPLYEPCTPLPELASATDHVMDHTFISGEGWLIPGEIREYPMCWRINWCFPHNGTEQKPEPQKSLLVQVYAALIFPQPLSA